MLAFCGGCSRDGCRLSQRQGIRAVTRSDVSPLFRSEGHWLCPQRRRRRHPVPRGSLLNTPHAPVRFEAAGDTLTSAEAAQSARMLRGPGTNKAPNVPGPGVSERTWNKYDLKRSRSLAKGSSDGGSGSEQ